MELGLNPTTSSDQDWMWPTRGIFISGYGWREGKMHYGIDVANKVGTPIVAAKSGRVVFSGWRDANFGYVVTLSHSDGTLSLYAHNSRLMVQRGEDVEQGSLISLMGSSGKSKDSHLHFEIHPPGSVAANPLQFLPGRTQPLRPDPAPLISEMPRTAPLQSLPAVEESAVVRFGDTVLKIAQRYGLTLQELLRLNPGLETARLVVGSQVRLAKASSTHPRMVLGLKPTTSGGISWPELPGFNELNTNVPTIKPLSPNEQAVLQRIRSNSGGNVPHLVGVVQVPGQSGSAIFQLGGSSTSAAVGESIGSSGWRLRSASGDTAVIEKGGEQRRISISSGF
jgi:murein DD-endopeptidase MepM/ murein hydrolase activator NlpD